MVDIDKSIAIITLKVNSLSTPIQRQKLLNRWKTRPVIFSTTKKPTVNINI